MTMFEAPDKEVVLECLQRRCKTKVMMNGLIRSKDQGVELWSVVLDTIRSMHLLGCSEDDDGYAAFSDAVGRILRGNKDVYRPKRGRYWLLSKEDEDYFIARSEDLAAFMNRLRGKSNADVRVDVTRDREVDPLRSLVTFTLRVDHNISEDIERLERALDAFYEAWEE